MKRLRDLACVAILVLADQIIKLYIYLNHMESNRDIIKGFLSFHPIFNRDYSWINSVFQFGVGRIFHIILVFIIFIIIIICYDYIRARNHMTKVVWLAFMLIISSAICSIIDKIFWNGSLDYVYLEGFFIFDLKDVYSSSFSVLMILLLIINYKKIKDINDKKMMKDFFGFIRNKYFRYKKNDI